MKLPHESLGGSLTAAIILTVILYFIARLLMKGAFI